MPVLHRKEDGDWIVKRFARDREEEENPRRDRATGFFTYQLDSVAESRLLNELNLGEGGHVPWDVFWQLRDDYHLYTHEEMEPRADLSRFLDACLSQDRAFRQTPNFNNLISPDGVFGSFEQFSQRFKWPGCNEDDITKMNAIWRIAGVTHRQMKQEGRI
jgi:hypothetical protein